MAKQTKPVVDRRNFLKGAAVGAAALAAGPASVVAQPPVEPKRIVPPPMSPAAETEVPAVVEVLTADRTGSDFMVDVMKSLGFEYVCANPGSSFRGLHESVINYGGNKSPEFITCCHEESSVAMAHGYSKVEGKPLAGIRARHGGIAARLHGDLQRVLRSRSGLRDSRQYHRRDQARRRESSGPTACRTPRRMVRDFIEVGRPADFAAAFRRIRRARLSTSR